MPDTEERPATDGSDELKKVLEFIQKYPDVITCLALIVSIVSALSSMRSAGSSEKSAENSATQLRLASRPSFYGKCTPTQNDFLKLSPVPNEVWFAIHPDSELELGRFNNPVPRVPNYEAEYPFMVARCSVTNIGKGAAGNIELEVKTIYLDDPKKETDVSQTMRIDYLGAGDRYDILIANRTPVAAIVFMPDRATFDVGVTGEHIVGDPILRGDYWTEVGVDNRPRPAGVNPIP